MVIIPLELRLTMMHGQDMVIFGLFIFVAVDICSAGHKAILDIYKIVEGIQFNAFLPVI